jgi:hypothetical protein
MVTPPVRLSHRDYLGAMLHAESLIAAGISWMKESGVRRAKGEGGKTEVRRQKGGRQKSEDRILDFRFWIVCNGRGGR